MEPKNPFEQTNEAIARANEENAGLFNDDSYESEDEKKKVKVAAAEINKDPSSVKSGDFSWIKSQGIARGAANTAYVSKMEGVEGAQTKPSVVEQENDGSTNSEETIENGEQKDHSQLNSLEDRLENITPEIQVELHQFADLEDRLNQTLTRIQEEIDTIRRVAKAKSGRDIEIDEENVSREMYMDLHTLIENKKAIMIDMATIEERVIALHEVAQEDQDVANKDSRFEEIENTLGEKRLAYIRQDLKRDKEVAGIKRFFGRTPDLGNFEQDHAQSLEEYQNSLRSYFEARTENTSEKDIERLVKEIGKDEFLDRENARTQVRTEQQGIVGRFSGMMQKSLEKYRALSFKKKLLVGAAIALPAVAAGAWAGTGVAATASGWAIGSRLVLSFGSGTLGFKGMFDSGTEERREQGLDHDVERITTSDHRMEGERQMVKLQELLENQIQDVDAQFQKQKAERLRNTRKAMLAAGLLTGASLAIGRFGSEWLSDKISQDCIEGVTPKEAFDNQWGDGDGYFGDGEPVNTAEIEDPEANVVGGDGDGDGADSITSEEVPLETTMPTELSGGIGLETPIDMTYDVQSGDTLWKVIENHLDSSGYFEGMNEAQRTHMIDAFEDHFEKLSEQEVLDIGISSGNVDILQVGETVDLKSAFGDQSLISKAFGEATNLSADDIDSIDHNLANNITEHSTDSAATGGTIESESIVESTSTTSPETVIAAQESPLTLNDWYRFSEGGGTRYTEMMIRDFHDIFDARAVSSTHPQSIDIIRKAPIQGILDNPQQHDVIGWQSDNLKHFVDNAVRVLGPDTGVPTSVESLQAYLTRVNTQADMLGGSIDLDRFAIPEYSPVTKEEILGQTDITGQPVVEQQPHPDEVLNPGVDTEVPRTVTAQEAIQRAQQTGPGAGVETGASN